ncbi:Ig-like domain-containing protein [Aquimarina sp. D1M17]|uniref:Ig-like domain-containing protein n=1 Tax=Aquimarina acroporae TaxID=2937283 RepID=UPI0020BE5317|nr:Ig-like domain-containing protein [Aquimarina acroporae]MCK8523818.1 Ig-like domain-containing protein [Aquimarina acroporae]
MLASCGTDDNLPPDTIPPSNITLTINDLSDDNTEPIRISKNLDIKVNAEDDRGVSKVEVFIDNQKINEDVTAPFEISVDVNSFETGEYTLKISVSDEAGNTASKEETIIIDNTIPSITNLSIANGTIIGGDQNELTFEVIDDTGIEKVNIYINDNNIEEITDDSYLVNIPTNDLADGNNEIRIVALDLTGNTSTANLNVVIDNSGPEITLESITEGQIVDALINFNPNVTDTFSEVITLEVLYNDQQLKLFNEVSNYSFDFDPEIYPVGAGNFKFIATDALGNSTTKEIRVENKRLLLTLNVPDNLVQQSTVEYWAFVSGADGKPLDTKQITRDISELKFYSDEEFTNDDIFTLTLVNYNNGNSYGLYSIQNLTRETPGKINLFGPKESRVLQLNVNYPSSGFSNTTSIRGRAIDHNGVEINDLFNISSFDPIWDENAGTEYSYVYANDPVTGNYSYEKIEKPFPNDYTLEATNFSTENIEQRTVEMTNSNQSMFFRLFGFDNEIAFNTDSYHEIFFGSIGRGTANYKVNTSFHKYRHRIALNDYITERVGLPSATYTRPNWNLDYSQNQNTISLTKDGQEHKVGQVYLTNQSNFDTRYSWVIVFDSQNQDNIVIPTIPEELSHLTLHSYSKSNTFEVRQVEISKYKGINSYSEYLNLVVKENKEYKEVSEEVDSIYKVINNSNALFIFWNFPF